MAVWIVSGWLAAQMPLAVFVGRVMRNADSKQIASPVPDTVPAEWVTQ